MQRYPTLQFYPQYVGDGGYHVSGAGMLGVYIRKDLDDLGKLEGVVAAYNNLTGYYKIAYIGTRRS